MKRVMRKSAALLLLAGAAVFAGELPELYDKPWTAWYAAYEGRKFQFGVDPDGEAALIPLKRNGERFPKNAWVIVEPVIEEIREDGRIVVKKPKDDGWEAITDANAEATEVAYRGTVTGGARFEARFEMDGDRILCGGRLLDKGGLTKHPVRFAVRVVTPNIYRNTRDEEMRLEKMEEDRFGFVFPDGRKVRHKGEDKVSALGEGKIAVDYLRLDLEGYEGARLELEGGEAGAFELLEGRGEMLSEGIVLDWLPDAEKNAEGEARFSLRFK